MNPNYQRQAMISDRGCLILVSLVLSLFLKPAFAFSATVVALKISPEKVGVLYQVGIQQFQAIAIFSDGSEEDYTQKVGWSLEEDPLEGQTLSPHLVAKIDETGKATVLNTWGRVKVVATYPKPQTPTANFSGILKLLFKKRCSVSNLDLCVEKESCENVGGYWWNDGECHSDIEIINTKNINFLPAIYLLLLQN